jgi:ArsR family transcriptional regulator
MATATRFDAAQVARWFHALSDETRLEIVRRLGSGERCVCELTDALGAAQSRLSFHLKTLRLAGIVTDRKQGRWVYYSLNPDVLDGIAAFVTEAKPPVGDGWRGDGGCCA